MEARPESRPEKVATELEREILDRRLSPGERLGLRTELIERFGVGANVMNEALRILRERNMVVVKPGAKGGVFVLAKPPHMRLGSLDLWFQGLVMDPIELFETRQVLEELFAGVALGRATPEDDRAMARGLAEMRRFSHDPRGFMEANVRFHMSIARASKLRLLEDMYEGIVALWLGGLVRAAFVGNTLPTKMEHNLEVHERIADAIRDGDRIALEKAIADHRVELVRMPEEAPVSVSDGTYRR